ncbi:MAG: TIGR02391 family protein [Acidobacteriaceae bacterium]
MDSTEPQLDANCRDDLAGIEYHGIGGSTEDCKQAVLRLIQFGTRIECVAVLSASNEHCLLLTINEGDLVAIKSGFASGYGGGGPHGFSYVLQLLESHGAEIEEYEVDPAFLDRLDRSALSKQDIERLEESKSRRTSRWRDYVDEKHFDQARNGTLWRDEFPPVIPFSIIDPRIMDLALEFWKNPDNSLLDGYRRLEDTVRRRTGIAHHGTKLFSQAYNPDGGALTWAAIDEGERSGRMQLFTGTYAAHRNPRAHRQPKDRSAALLTEFLLLNHLYGLERDSVPNPDSKIKQP